MAAEGRETTQTMDNNLYTCPMHPEVVSDKQGRCPKCGMKLEPKRKRQCGREVMMKFKVT